MREKKPENKPSNITEKAPTQVSIRWKVLVGFVLLFTLIYIVALNLFTNLAVNAADTQVKADLTQTLEGIATTTDVELLLELVAEGEPNADGFSDDPRFVELLGFLVQTQKVEPDAWPYLYIPSENENEILFVVDVWAASDDPGSAGGFLEPYTSNSGWIVAGLSDQVFRAVDRQFVQDIKNRAASIEEKLPQRALALENFGIWLTNSGLFPQKDFGTYGDQFGRWASGYMPIRDAEGNPVAAVGVDFQADYLNEVRNSVQIKVRNAFLYAFPVMLAIIYLAANFVTKPLMDLAEGADRIAEGDYKVDFTSLVKGRFQDEIDTLAKVFAEMVEKIRVREMTLRREVAKLRIEIDHTKKLTEVNQIVETDFFRDLQKRATDLRSRRETK